MNNCFGTQNSVSRRFRNVFGSGLFLAFVITVTIYTSLVTIGTILSMANAGYGGNYVATAGILTPILLIIGTIGLFNVYFGVKGNDSPRIVTGLKMSKCIIALLVIGIILMYVVSVCTIVLCIFMLIGGSLILEGVTSEIADILDGIDFEINNMDEFFDLFGHDLSFAFIVTVVLVVGILMLVFSILFSVYRHGISKAVKSAILSETTGCPEPKISGFTAVFGYILGSIVVLNSFSFGGNNRLPSGVLMQLLQNVSLGVIIFLFSLIMSNLKRNVSAVPTVSQRRCEKCGSFIPIGAQYCTNCNASVYSTQPVTPVTPVDPTASESDSEPIDNTTVEEKAVPAFCSACGSPVTPDQKFCTNCGNKL